MRWPEFAKNLSRSFMPALTYGNFARLWCGNIGSTTAHVMQTVAAGWLIVELTDSPFTLGLVSFFRFAPMLLCSPFGGVLADRFNRVSLILIAQVSMAISAFLIGILVLVQRIEIWHLIIGSVVIGISFSINVPARHAMIGDLVPRKHVANAVGLNNVTWSASNVIAPSVAGFLIRVSGIASAYFVQILAYAWSIANIRLVQSPQSETVSSESFLTSLRQGYSYISRSGAVLALLFLTVGVALFATPIVMLLPSFVKYDMAGGPQDLGLLMGVMGAGSLVGALVMVSWARYPYKARRAFLAMSLYGLVLVGLSLSKSMFTAGVLLSVMGFCDAVYLASTMTALQLLVPSEIRGRVLSVWMSSWGLMAIGLLAMSAIAERFGVLLAMSSGGVLTLMMVLLVLGWKPELWSLRDDTAESSSETSYGHPPS